jgi:serine/threonine protein kinase
MAMQPGTRLGPYEILGAIGAGGMGEVYRAKDTRLDRTVAIKVLPSHLSADPERKQRFEREARTISSLNHPHICTLHDIGHQDGIDYLVMEYVEGESLAQRLEKGPLPTEQVLRYGIQIAEALDKAHRQSIIHRDLKPGNIMLTKSGAKLLDFGLAKYREAKAPTPGQSQMETKYDPLTEEGVVLGTVQYMAPEQLEGRAADERTDIFALGEVIYEMATGQRTFKGTSKAQLMAAILSSEPPPISTIQPLAPAGLDHVVKKCLAKDPDDRWQDAGDVAGELKWISEIRVQTPSGTTPTALARRSFRPWLAFTFILALAVAVFAAFLAGRSYSHSTPSRITRLTFQRGQVDTARFGPDGQTIVYSASWNGNPFEVFFTRLESVESRSLGLSATTLAAMSPSGEMALLRNPFPIYPGWPTITFGMLANESLSGSGVRDIAEGIQFADWTPDGKQLLVVRSGNNGKARLEFPLGHVLYETGDLIANPRFSPRGDRISFIDLSPGNRSSIVVVDLKGKTTTLTNAFSLINGLAWSAKGDEVWFAGGQDLPKELIAVTLSGRQRVVYRSLTAIRLFDIAADSRVLLGQEVRRRELWGRTQGALEDRNLTWMDTSSLNSCSFDGKTVIINEFGEGGGADHGVYLRPTDGSTPVRIGSGSVMDRSPDGKWVLTILHEDTSRQQIVLLPTGVGQPKELPTESLKYTAGVFSPDGNKIIFGAIKPGEAQALYVQDVNGGPPRRAYGQGLTLVPTPSFMSADGRFLVQDYSGPLLLQSITGGEPRPIQGLAPEETIFGFTNDGRLYAGRGQSTSGITATGARNSESPPFGGSVQLFRLDPTTGRREPWKKIGPTDTTGAWPIDGVCVTPDGSSYVYNFARRLSDLYVIEGLR